MRDEASRLRAYNKKPLIEAKTSLSGYYWRLRALKVKVAG